MNQVSCFFGLWSLGLERPVRGVGHLRSCFRLSRLESSDWQVREALLLSVHDVIDLLFHSAKHSKIQDWDPDSKNRETQSLREASQARARNFPPVSQIGSRFHDLLAFRPSSCDVSNVLHQCDTLRGETNQEEKQPSWLIIRHTEKSEIPGSKVSSVLTLTASSEPITEADVWFTLITFA